MQFSFILNPPAPLRPDPLVPRLVVPTCFKLNTESICVIELQSKIESIDPEEKSQTQNEKERERERESKRERC